jgi:hypothetical protein
MKWPQDAEDYCLNEVKVEKIIRQKHNHLYDLSGLASEAVVALFDKDGFLIIQVSGLYEQWGPGFFPDGIRAFPDYLSKIAFEVMSWKADSIKRAVANSGKPFMSEHPNRSADDQMITMLAHKWRTQNETCYICNAKIGLVEAKNPMLRIARGMIDSSKKTYDFANTMIGHYACILAKNKFSMTQVAEWRACVLSGTIIMDDKSEDQEA